MEDKEPSTAASDASSSSSVDASYHYVVPSDTKPTDTTPKPTQFPYRTFPRRKSDDRKSISFNLEECLETLRGNGIPSDLSSWVARCCVVRAIRLYPQFAEADTTLHLYDSDNEDFQMVFVRARNARKIMSGTIPDDMDDAEAQPYCIWHPEFASEDTYRQLVKQYPVMKYQVGRACAAAGYADLYAELDVLPDVSIAEEARESTNPGSKQIYDTIMGAPFKYKVMDDNTKTINTETPRYPAYLDAETDVLWVLQDRTELYEGRASTAEESFANGFLPNIEEDYGLHFETIQFGLTEDELQYKDEFGATLMEKRQQSIRDELDARWLYEPLPLDLPTLRIRLPRNMAAYEGNIDRYARLEGRSELFEEEFLCILRGIYHNTMFARWWHQRSLASDFKIPVHGYSDEKTVSWLRTAINARRIMINDVDHFHKDSNDLPSVIWWPTRPNMHALFRLLENCPQMKHQITVAAIICDYEQLYRKINPVPSIGLKLAAEASTNPWYLTDILQRSGRDDGFESEERSPVYDGTHTLYDTFFEHDDDDVLLSNPSGAYMIQDDYDWGTQHPYADRKLVMNPVERYVWLNKTAMWKLRELFYGVAMGGSKCVEEYDPDETEKAQDAENARSCH